MEYFCKIGENQLIIETVQEYKREATMKREKEIERKIILTKSIITKFRHLFCLT